jgi:L-arabinose isomerase
VDAWIDAARVAHVMSHNRLGLMGHYYNGMLDIYSDTTLQCATFGGHPEIVEVDELAALRRNVSDEEIAARVALFRERKRSTEHLSHFCQRFGGYGIYATRLSIV